MLVLERGVNDEIIITDETEIKMRILSIAGNKVKIGFDAPRYISILRQECINATDGIEAIDGAKPQNK